LGVEIDIQLDYQDVDHLVARQWRVTHKVRRGFATHPHDAKVAERQQYLRTPNSPSLPAAWTNRRPRNTQNDKAKLTHVFIL
jgi:hypothetical protein